MDTSKLRTRNVNMNGKREQSTITLPARELVTQQQVNVLMQIAATSMSMLGSLIHVDPDNRDHVSRVGGEARTAAESLFIKTCDQLEKIVGDSSRWDSTFQSEVEKSFREAHELQMETMTSQKEAADEILTPHFRYRPALVKMMDGTYLAFLGSVDDLDNSICGLGANPAEAVMNFDAAFCGEIDPAIVTWLKIREQVLETGGITPPFPTKTKIDEQQQLDPGTDSSLNQMPPSGGDLGGDSPAPGQEPDSLPGEA